MEVIGAHQMFGYPYSSKYFILCSAKEEKFIQVWNNVMNFNFLVNYPFNFCLL